MSEEENAPEVVLRGKELPETSWGISREFEAEFHIRVKGYDRRTTRHQLASRIARILSVSMHQEVDVHWAGDVDTDGVLMVPSDDQRATQETIRLFGSDGPESEGVL